MNKFYDKIVLVLAILALIAGLAVSVISNQPASEQQASQPDNPYLPVPVPQTEFPEIIWQEPEAQASGFIYDVFTPFEIYVDKEGNFTQVGPNISVLANDFGSPYLMNVERPLYRIQMEGFIAEDPADQDKVLILFYDRENERSVRARPGNEYAASSFSVDDFRIERITEESGAIYKIAYSLITDLRTGQQLELNDAAAHYNEGFSVTIGNREDLMQTTELNAIGSTFSMQTGSYSLDDVDLSRNSVTVTKLGDDYSDPITRELFVEETTVQESQENDDSSEANGLMNNANSDFNAFFN